MLKRKQNIGQKNQQAFTFVEVLVAIMLVAVVMTALGSMMVMSMRVAEANEMEQLAQLKAQQTMEFFRRERLVRGWSEFFTNLEEKTYCLNDLPSEISLMGTTPWNYSCLPGSYQSDLNFFYYSIEAIVQNKLTTSPEQSLDVLIEIYRRDKDGNQIGTDAFFSSQQTFKQY
jgi:prepilin-type N-terminal cleavage/methylation domain-containing protein